MFREDGRRSNDIRRIDITKQSSYIYLRQGNTHVRAKVNGPKEGNKLYFKVYFGSTSRQEQINEKRVYEYENELYSIYSNIIACDSQVEVDIDVLQEDGSVLSVMINCVALVLCHSNVPLADFPCSITYSKTGIDLCSSEEGGRACGIILVYLMNRNKVVYFKSIGRITVDLLQTVNDIGIEGCSRIYEVMKKYLIDGTVTS